jgi:hypothetical protein
MLYVDDKPETLHIYVVREEAPKPQLYPIFLSVLALASLVALSIVIPYQQPVTRAVIRVPAVLLPIRTFTVTTAIIPTGVKVYPATTAHGTLTITNGSIIAQVIPAGFTIQNVATNRAVYVPAGSANGYGYATVSAHTLISGHGSNLSPYSINSVVGSSVFVRNLSAFSGGEDAYSVKFITSNDRYVALSKVRNMLTSKIMGLHYPCAEDHIADAHKMIVTWHCLFVRYSVSSYMHVTGVRLAGKSVIVAVMYIQRPMLMYWVK